MASWWPLCGQRHALICTQVHGSGGHRQLVVRWALHFWYAAPFPQDGMQYHVGTPIYTAARILVPCLGPQGRVTGQEGSPTLGEVCCICSGCRPPDESPKPKSNTNTCDRPHTSFGVLTSSFSCFHHHHNSSQATKNLGLRAIQLAHHHPSSIPHHPPYFVTWHHRSPFGFVLVATITTIQCLPVSHSHGASGALTEHRWSCVQPDSSFRDPPAALPDHRETALATHRPTTHLETPTVGGWSPLQSSSSPARATTNRPTDQQQHASRMRACILSQTPRQAVSHSLTRSRPKPSTIGVESSLLGRHTQYIATATS